jgi:hypothetical protein
MERFSGSKDSFVIGQLSFVICHFDARDAPDAEEMTNDNSQMTNDKWLLNG